MEDFANRLLTWFDAHGRTHLPWQQDISPYRVWVSEIMLQQTQVTTVIPYFERFMQAFPSVADLAAAEQDLVLHHWTGLGYYARARNLHKTAQILVRDYNGEFPLTVAELQALPGIGRSTAGAIVAICTDTSATILDGNVKRVLARCFAVTGWPGSTATQKALWAKAEALTPESRVADYTQAIMDLGATLCTRRSPACERCPFEGDCEAQATDNIDEFPGRKPKQVKPVRDTTMFMLENTAGEWLLEQRPQQGLWGGLWSFPEDESLEDLLARVGIDPSKLISEQGLGGFRHTFTHFHLDITPVHVKLRAHAERVSEPGRCWYSTHGDRSLGLTRPVTRLLKQLEQKGTGST